MAVCRAARPKIADVAREAGVSKSAVSFAFNRPGRLNAATAARILDVADQMGYRPDPVARMLAAGQTGTIGILTPQTLDEAFANPFFALFAEGVARATEARGFGLLFMSPLQGSIERALGRATVDGLVAVGVDERHPEVSIVRRAGIPLVLVDAPAWPGHGAIEVDDEGGARQAAQHLVDAGHRDVVVVSMAPASEVDPTESVMSRRLRGYRSVFEAVGVALDDERVIATSATFEGGEAAFRTILQRGLHPTAVLAMSDAAAIGVLRGVRAAGLRVPQDLSVVGFDDLPFAAFTDPPLTTVHQPVRRKGEEAVLLLLEGLARPGAVAEHRVLPTHLVIRGSTAPAARVGGQRLEVVVHHE